jgi:hypothetical protein
MRKIFSDIRRLAEFEKDLKKLSKKYRTLEDDLETFTNTQLQSFHKLKQDNRGVLHISDIGISYPKIYKAKNLPAGH